MSTAGLKKATLRAHRPARSLDAWPKHKQTCNALSVDPVEREKNGKNLREACRRRVEEGRYSLRGQAWVRTLELELASHDSMATGHMLQLA